MRVSECVDEVRAMRAVNDKLRKFLFTESNRVSKSVKQFTLKCCSELEEQMMRKIAKNRTLLWRLDECERQQREKNVHISENHASVAAKTAGVRVPAAKHGVSASVPVRKRSNCCEI